MDNIKQVGIKLVLQWLVLALLLHHTPEQPLMHITGSAVEEELESQEKVENLESPESVKKQLKTILTNTITNILVNGFSIRTRYIFAKYRR